MYLSKPSDYQKVLDLKRASNIMTVEVERSIFGFDHQEVGSEILKAWNIPENIRMPIAYHHRKNGCPSEYSDMIDVLMISDMLSSFYHDSRSIEKIAVLKQTLGSALKMNEADAEAFIDEVAERTLEILSSFEIDKGDMKPYSQILQEANEELGKLNLSYEQLVIELKDAKRDAENYAVELWDVKEKMREIAVKDSLTGLFNHRYFQELLEREIYRAERYARPLSLLMIDIDHFKKVNDTYGHPKGDMVLQEIGELLRKSIRGSDTAARYGGEEFAIVLPETEMNGAMALAERVRKTVEKLEVKIYEHTITVTISIGLTTYNPATAKKSKAEIIEAADRALYNSKEAGRNRLSVS
ncbi:MAG: GGDEF domain-containing protein, partial [Nitrospirota bacterium]|nr:GGDEF domain-containing protein [Nitrospirota bacterium]